MIAAGPQAHSVAGWTRAEFKDAANWRYTKCSCENCLRELLLIDATWNLACMLTVGPATEPEVEAANKLLKLKSEWGLHFPGRYSPHRGDEPE